MNFTVHPPPGFRLRSVVLSHGWADLPPFHFDSRSETLSVGFVLPDGTAARSDISETGGGLAVRSRVSGDRGPSGRSGSTRRLRPADRAFVEPVIRSVLRLDADLGPFYRAASRHPRFRWVRRLGAGRLLRSPSVFEDTVKMICTTNCSWALTRAMIRNLCEELGGGPPGARAFPTPAAMASRSEGFYRAKIRSGYRSPYLVKLSRRVAVGELAIERWRDTAVPAEQVAAEIRSVQGVGPYAAGNLLKLLGRYDELGIDSWCRKRFALLHRNGRRTTDSAIERHYAGYGEWKGLFFWLDLTRDWYGKSYEEIFR